jgi:hypothetical protein
MLAEVDVLNAVAAHLRSEGYRIVEQRSTAERGIDLVAVKANGAVCWVEAKGGTSSRPGSPGTGDRTMRLKCLTSSRRASTKRCAAA